MDSNGNVLEMRPSERGHSSFRYLTPLIPTETPKERIEWLWNKLKTQDYAFNDVTKGDPRWFLAELFAPGTEHFLVDDSGYVVVSGFMPKTSCMIHLAVWEQIQPIKLIAAIRELISYLFSAHDLHRVTAAVPTYNKQAQRLAILLGFRYEGELRQSILSHGKYHGVEMYGLLRSEFEKKEAPN